MKKVFLMLAFTAFVGSVSASTGDDDKGKKETKKEAKACCKDKTAAADGKSCSAADKKEGKSCCKAKTADAKPAEKK